MEAPKKFQNDRDMTPTKKVIIPYPNIFNGYGHPFGDLATEKQSSNA